MSEELVFLDLCVPDKRERQSKEAYIASEAEKTRRRCESLFRVFHAMCDLSIPKLDEMEFVFRLEEYFERNKHLGVHWFRQLRKLVNKYEKVFEEKRVQWHFLGR